MPVQIFCTISFAADEDEEKKREQSFEQFSEEDEEDEEEEGEQPPSAVSFAGSTTLHGMNHIFVEGGCGVRQVLWGCAFLSSLAIFLYQVMDRVMYYLEYHHVTVLDEIDSHFMYFPAVTLCNFNRFRRSKITYADLERIGPLLGYTKGMDVGFQLAQSGDNDNSLLSMYELFNRTSHQLEDMLKECKYRAQECGPENFTVGFVVGSTRCTLVFFSLLEDDNLGPNIVVLKTDPEDINSLKHAYSFFFPEIQ